MKLSEYKLLKKYMYWNMNKFDEVFTFQEIKFLLKNNYKSFSFQVYLLKYYFNQLIYRILKSIYYSLKPKKYKPYQESWRESNKIDWWS